MNAQDAPLARRLAGVDQNPWRGCVALSDAFDRDGWLAVFSTVKALSKRAEPARTFKSTMDPSPDDMALKHGRWRPSLLPVVGWTTCRAIFTREHTSRFI